MGSEMPGVCCFFVKSFGGGELSFFWVMQVRSYVLCICFVGRI